MKGKRLNIGFFVGLLSLCNGVKDLASDSGSIEFRISEINPSFFNTLKIISENGFSVSFFPSRYLADDIEFFSSKKKLEDCIRVYIVKC